VNTRPRFRRIYVLWAIALTLLLALGLFSWLVVVPVWQARSVLRNRIPALSTFGEREGHVPIPTGVAQAVVSDLGGQDAASRKLTVSVRYWPMDDWHTHLAVRVLGHCGERGREELKLIVRSGPDAYRDTARWVLEHPPGWREKEDEAATWASLLAHADPLTRVAGAQHLGEMGTSATRQVPDLERLRREDSDARVREVATEAIKKIKAAREVTIAEAIKHLESHGSRRLDLRTDVDRHIRRGDAAFAEKHYAKAKRHYLTAAELIRWAPASLDLSAQQKQVEKKLELCAQTVK